MGADVCIKYFSKSLSGFTRNIRKHSKLPTYTFRILQSFVTKLYTDFTNSKTFFLAVVVYFIFLVYSHLLGGRMIFSSLVQFPVFESDDITNVFLPSLLHRQRTHWLSAHSAL
jgi:cyanate permease